jgi:UDP-glucose 4-epimerase
MNRIFITGGAGFIGSHLVDRLFTGTIEVVVYDNLSTGKTDNLKHHCSKTGFQFIEGDLLDESRLVQSMKGCNLVFHIAAHSDVREGKFKPRIDLDNGVIATWNVLESMRTNGIQKIVHASSASVYGETQPIPMSEDFGPLLPVSLYGAGKVAAEALISAYCHTFDIQAWMFRFANVVGSRRQNGVITDLVRKLRANPEEFEILGDGSQCKPYIHVSECVDGILFGYEHGQDKVNLYNVGVESATDVTTIAEIIVKEMRLNGARFKYTGGDRGWKGDAPQLRFNMGKMKKLGWQARLSSDEAVVKAVREIIKELP